jgi:hypothetical protein
MAVRKKRASAAKSKRRSSTKAALAVRDPVKREEPAATLALSTLSLDKQQAWIRRAAAWSPVAFMMAQQAAFWRGFAGGGADTDRKSSRSR